MPVSAVRACASSALALFLLVGACGSEESAESLSLVNDEAPPKKVEEAPPSPAAFSSPNVPLGDALGSCLVGRRHANSEDQSRLPAYNYGYGFLCDQLRSSVYRDCRKGSEDKQACVGEADEVRRACRKDPCPESYNLCMRRRCKRSGNDWNCWSYVDGELTFGFYQWQNNQWSFSAETGEEVSEKRWSERCRAVEDRCERGLTAEEGDVVPPIDRSFLSASVYGHNCHHASQAICDCVAASTDQGNPLIVVLDSGGAGLPQPVGNLYHSLLEVDHPTRSGQRCLVETQTTAKGQAVDDRCCYAVGERDELPEQGCPLATWGPKKRPHQLSMVSSYTCEGFLKARGVEEGEIPKTLLAEPLNL